MTLSLSPLHLFVPVFEMQAEVKLASRFSVAAIAGYGSTEIQSPDPELNGQDVAVMELGAQVVGYPLDDFESLQLGVEVLWVRADLDDVDVGESSVSASAEGVAVGPLIGYKYLANSGFSLIVQGGAQYMAVRGEAQSSSGETANDEQNDWIPLINFNLGWSF